MKNNNILTTILPQPVRTMQSITAPQATAGEADLQWIAAVTAFVVQAPLD